MAKNKLLQSLEWLGHAQTVYSLFTVLLPAIAAIVTRLVAYWEDFTWTYILVAASLAFMGTASGMLRASEWAERKNLEINSASKARIFFVIWYQHRRPPECCLALARSTHRVNRNLEKGQISVSVKNDASFPISCIVQTATTRIEGLTPPRTSYPMPATLIAPGATLNFGDEPMDMKEMPCRTLTGEMDFIIKYGLPGREKHEMRLRGRLKVQMESFGFVSGVATTWVG